MESEKNFNTEKEAVSKNILYKVPLLTFSWTLMLCILLEIIIFAFPGRGEYAGMGAVVFALWIPVILFLCTFISFLISLGYYLVKRRR
ncbi:MAG: hypothetical protein ACD_2C00160G0004 [uncultured bacterium (gcode 4)]|uniref:Uncharacterized protein n=1 Tax=uncultured bacterium (gcode 4) TaxID=1234023 RepID=K2H0Y4_9BACT|nr:MAG: hypothetical protein ACD_2C00160G0004 [uncultured bacterium (gcode 4)]